MTALSEQDAWEALERAEKGARTALEDSHVAQGNLRRAIARLHRARSEWQAAAIRKGETK